MNQKSARSATDLSKNQENKPQQTNKKNKSKSIIDYNNMASHLNLEHPQW